ncbi:hypothetical protein ACFGVR_05570 [Mucilaginibacter sp. AW1-3]
MTEAIYLVVDNNRDPIDPRAFFLVLGGFILLIYVIIRMINAGYFEKKPSDAWEGLPNEGSRKTLFYYVYCLEVAVVAAQLTAFKVMIAPPKMINGDSVDNGFSYIWFGLSIFLLFGGLLNSFMIKTDSSFSDYPYLRYIMRVWITNILVSPLILTIILVSKDIVSSGIPTIIGTYLFGVLTGNGFGMLGFAVFAYNVHHLSILGLSEHRKKLKIFITTQLLILVTTIVFSFKSTLGLNWFWTWLPYALVTGFCVWYYKLEKPIPVEDAIVVEDEFE